MSPFPFPPRPVEMDWTVEGETDGRPTLTEGSLREALQAACWVTLHIYPAAAVYGALVQLPTQAVGFIQTWTTWKCPSLSNSCAQRHQLISIQ